MPVIPSGRYLNRLISAFIRIGARLAGRESPWERVSMRVPETVFGPGSQRPFAAYFEGESGVPVRSIDDIVAWLQSCEYVTDLEQFNQRDVWQHPGAFERLRRGDCEDFALWAWRKLAELGIEAELCVGRVVVATEPGIDRQHAWVVYHVDGAAYLFEAAARTPALMIRPLEEAMDQYVPHFAVNHRFDTNAFVGCADDSRRLTLDGPDFARST